MVELPVSDAPVGVGPHAPSLPARRDAASPLRVLVVDDNVDAPEVPCEALGMLGYEARTSSPATTPRSSAGPRRPDSPWAGPSEESTR
jgi:hypothetical protein